MKLIKILYFLFLCISSLTLCAQNVKSEVDSNNEFELKRNFVLLIDRSIDAEEAFYSKGKELFSNYILQTIVGAGYEDGDFLSIVTFGLSPSDWRIRDFIYANQKYLLSEQPPNDILKNYYNDIIKSDSNYFNKTNSYSSLSIIMATKEFGTKDIEVDETIFIVVSPNIAEVSISNEVIRLQKSNFKDKEEIINNYNSFIENFTIETVSNEFIENINISVKKLKPLSKSISSFVKINNLKGNNTLFYKYADGEYIIPIELATNKNSEKLSFREMSLSLKDGEQLVNKIYITNLDDKHIEIVSDVNPINMTLIVETLLKFEDAFYSRQLISHRSDEQLKYKIGIAKDTSKKVLGIFSLPDSMIKLSSSLGGGSSMDGNVLWWNIVCIIGILTIALFILILYIRAKGKNEDSKSIEIN